MKKSLFFTLTLISMLLSSCVDPINIDPGAGEVQLVVDGTIVYDPADPLKTKPDTVKLTYSVPFTDNTTKVYENAAKVTVTELTTGFVDTLRFVSNGLYETQKLVPFVGGIYKLSITLPSGKQFEATSSIGRPPYFERFEARDTNVRNTNLPNGPIAEGAYINMFIYDSAGLGDSYRLKYYVKRKNDPNNPYVKEKPGTADRWVFFNQLANLWLLSESETVNSGILSTIDSYEKFDFLTTISINQTSDDRSRPAYYPGDSVMVEVQSITQDNLFFWVRLQQEGSIGNGGPFAGLIARPVSNVPSNIKGINTDTKALGWFSAGSRVVRKLGIPETFSFKQNQGFQP